MIRFLSCAGPTCTEIARATNRVALASVLQDLIPHRFFNVTVVAQSAWRHDREVVLDKQQLPDYGIDLGTGYQKIEWSRSSLYLLQNAANLSSKQAPNLQSSFSEIFWASRRLAAREKKPRLSNRMPSLAAAHKQYSRMILKGKYAQDQILSTRTRTTNCVQTLAASSLLEIFKSQQGRTRSRQNRSYYL